MGTINDKLNKLNQTKTNIKNELRGKGADVKDNDTFGSYANYLHDLEILNAQAKTVNPSISSQTVLPDSEYNALSQVTVNPVTSNIDNNIQSYNIKAGVSILGVEGNVEPDKPDQNKTVNPSTSIQEVVADTGYELAKVTVNPVTASIDSNIVSNNIKSGVSILGVNGNVIELNGQTKTVTPTTSQQVITPDQNYNALTQVTVNAVPDETEVLDEQDDLLDTQETTIADLEEALNNKIALDLTNATSDANATASDIKQGKSAYVNGEKVLGTLEVGGEWELDSTVSLFRNNTNMTYYDEIIKHCKNSTSTSSMFSGNTIITNLDLQFNNTTDTSYMFYNCNNLKSVNLDMNNEITNSQQMFRGCYALETITGNINLSKSTNIQYMFYQCFLLKTLPAFDISSNTGYLGDLFFACRSLTDEGLNNVLRTLITAKSTSTFSNIIGYNFTSYYPKSRMEALPAYQDFINAGWTLGY